MNASVPGCGHNHPPRDWWEIVLERLQKLIGKLRDWAQEAVRCAVRLLKTEVLCRKVDMQLAADLEYIARQRILEDEDGRALVAAAGLARGGGA